MAVPPAFVRLAAHPVRWRLLSELADSDRRVRELVELLGKPQNLVSYHLRLLRGGGLVAARRSAHDARDSYYTLDLASCAAALAATGAALHPGLRLAAAPPGAGPAALPAVLFTCTGNSARSPIAEALLRQRTGGRAEVASAGSHARERLHQGAVRILRERHGIRLDQRPRGLDAVAARRFDYVISLCDKVREVTPDLPGPPRRIHWSIPDPAASDERDGHAAFARVAAEIENRITYLLPRLTAQEVSP